MILRDMRDPHARIDSHLDYICSRAQATQRALPPDGLEAWRQVAERGYEGLVAKDEAGAYEAGRRGAG
jgi:ATP-dependent DNA ligase